MQPLWKTLWNFLRKLKMELPFDPVIPLLGLYPKNPGTSIQKNLCTPVFIAAQFTLAKCWKQPKCPSVNEWIKKLWYIYMLEYYYTERKKELLPLTAWMELESIMLSEISHVVWGTVPSMGNVAQPPLGKASGERGWRAGPTSMHRFSSGKSGLHSKSKTAMRLALAETPSP